MPESNLLLENKKSKPAQYGLLLVIFVAILVFIITLVACTNYNINRVVELQTSSADVQSNAQDTAALKLFLLSLIEQQRKTLDISIVGVTLLLTLIGFIAGYSLISADKILAIRSFVEDTNSKVQKSEEHLDKAIKDIQESLRITNEVSNQIVSIRNRFNQYLGAISINHIPYGLNVFKEERVLAVYRLREVIDRMDIAMNLGVEADYEKRRILLLFEATEAVFFNDTSRIGELKERLSRNDYGAMNSADDQETFAVLSLTNSSLGLLIERFSVNEAKLFYEKAIALHPFNEYAMFGHFNCIQNQIIRDPEFLQISLEFLNYIRTREDLDGVIDLPDYVAKLFKWAADYMLINSEGTSILANYSLLLYKTVYFPYMLSELCYKSILYYGGENVEITTRSASMFRQEVLLNIARNIDTKTVSYSLFNFYDIVRSRLEIAIIYYDLESAPNDDNTLERYWTACSNFIRLTGNIRWFIDLSEPTLLKMLDDSTLKTRIQYTWND